MSDIITQADKYVKGWSGGLPETPCGFGSKLSNTNLQRKWIPDIIEKYGIQSVADIGAGDLNWIRHMEIDVEYKAYDLIPRQKGVIQFDLINEIPPAVDMIMCLWVLNHFPFAHCLKALENIKASGSKYLMMTDRPIWHKDQPNEIIMAHIEQLVLNGKGDNIQLIELC